MLKKFLCILAIGSLCLTPVQITFADDETDLFSVAQKAFDDGFNDVAIRYINQFLAQYPQSQKTVQAKILLGQCYFFQNQYLKAYEIFNGLLEFNEFKDATLFWLGETHLKGADYPQAEKFYKQLIDLYPDSIYRPQAYYSLGWTYFDQGDYESAKKTFAHLVKMFPTHQLREDGLFKLGESLYNQKNYKDAIKVFEDYLRQYPQSTRTAQVYFYIGESYYYLDDYLTASTFYAKASDISLDRKVTLMAKISQGWCYHKLQRYDLSEQTFDEALALSKNNELRDDIYLGKATLYTDQGNHDKALEYYSKLIAEFPESPRLAEAYLGKANNLYLKKAYPEAINEFTALIQSLGDHPAARDIVEKAYFGLAWTYLKNDQADLAVEQFQKLAQKTDSKITKVSALIQTGDAYQEIEQLEKAVEIYDKILKEYPDSPFLDYVQYRQAIALLKQDKLESAMLSFKTLAANFPKSKHIQDTQYFLGIAYYKKEDWRGAIDYLEKYLKSPSGEFLGQANYILALSYFNANDAQQALKIFQSTASGFPEEPNLIKNAEMGAAKSLYALGQKDQAIEKFKQIAEKYTNSQTAQDALLWLGNHFLETEDYKQAIAFYEEILRRFPESAQKNFVNYAIAQSYENLQQYEQALNYYKKIDDPNAREIYMKAKLAIAGIFSRETDPTSAIQTYESIIANSPDFKRDAYMRLAELYKAKQNYEKSLEIYQQALAADTGLSTVSNPEIQFYVADTYELLHNNTKAVEEYFKIPYLYPNNHAWEVKAYLRIARLFEDSEKWEDATAIYNKILAYKTDEAVYAKERLDWLAENINLESQ